MSFANNLLKFVDPDGRAPRLYVNQGGIWGHAFVSTGSGNNLKVYTYGRYGAINQSSFIPKKLSPSGEGVLRILKGNEATKYISEEAKCLKSETYEFTNGSDEKVDKYFNDQFNSSNLKPSEGNYSNDENSRVINNYNVGETNCVTTSLSAISQGINQDITDYATTPIGLSVVMNAKTSWDTIVKSISNLFNSSSNLNITIKKIKDDSGNFEIKK